MTKRDKTVIEALEENIKTCAIFGAPMDLFRTLLTEYSRVVKERDEAVNDLKRYVADRGDSCSICAYYVPCMEKECPYYCEGNEGEIDGRKVEFKWTCMDFDYGDCQMRENAPCRNCNVAEDWVYKKVYHDAD